MEGGHKLYKISDILEADKILRKPEVSYRKARFELPDGSVFRVCFTEDIDFSACCCTYLDKLKSLDGNEVFCTSCNSWLRLWTFNIHKVQVIVVVPILWREKQVKRWAQRKMKDHEERDVFDLIRQEEDLADVKQFLPDLFDPQDEVEVDGGSSPIGRAIYLP